MKDDRFEVTAQHIKLIQRMQIGWVDDEFGAPEVDPKRPYGNSDAERDICEIVYPERLLNQHSRWTSYEDVPDELRDELRRLHRETQQALEICLRTLSFEPGVATKERYSSNWKREVAS